MAHLHDIYDSDEHFIIAPAARTISTESTKLVLGWQDHNSERYTFEMPRFVEGHDMLECNEVQIHFDNVSSNRRTTNSDYYTVTDLQVSPASEDVVIFSWLISESATELVGKLSFSIHFACVSDDGEQEYSWHTTTFEGISILKGIHNTKALVEKHSDFVSRMEQLADKALGAIVDYHSLLSQITDLANTADGYVEDEVVFDFKQEDWTIYEEYECHYIKTDVDLSFILEHDRNLGFYIEVEYPDGYEDDDGVAHEFAVRYLFSPTYTYIRTEVWTKDGFEFRRMYDDGSYDVGIWNCDLNNAPIEHGGCFLWFHYPAPTVFRVHKVTRSLNNRMHDLIEAGMEVIENDAY